MFPELPPELILLILAECHSARDLYSLLAASPSCYRVFANARERTLLSVLRRVVPAPVMGHFAAVCHASAFTFDKEDPVVETTNHDANDVSAFLDRYFSSGGGGFGGFGGFGMPSTVADLMAAHRLHARISHFMSDYVRNAAAEMAFLAEHGVQRLDAFDFRPGRAIRSYQLHRGAHAADMAAAHFDGGESPGTIDTSVFEQTSPTEAARLYRAFLRLELQSRLFRRGSSSTHATRGAFLGREQFDLFLKKMEPWEVEEMTCVHQYFLYAAWDALKESIQCGGNDADSSTATTDRQGGGEGDAEEIDNVLYHFGQTLPFALTCLNDNLWPVFISAILLRGVDFLYSALVTQKGNRRQGRRRRLDEQQSSSARPGELRAGTALPHFLVSALEIARFHTHPVTPLPTRQPTAVFGGSMEKREGREEEEEDILRPSVGFCRHTQSSRVTDRYLPILKFEGHAAVRATGYVFWDARKIRSWTMDHVFEGANALSFERYHDRYGRHYKDLLPK